MEEQVCENCSSDCIRGVELFCPSTDKMVTGYACSACGAIRVYEEEDAEAWLTPAPHMTGQAPLPEKVVDPEQAYFDRLKERVLSGPNSPGVL